MSWKWLFDLWFWHEQLAVPPPIHFPLGADSAIPGTTSDSAHNSITVPWITTTEPHRWARKRLPGFRTDIRMIDDSEKWGWMVVRWMRNPSLGKWNVRNDVCVPASELVTVCMFACVHSQGLNSAFFNCFFPSQALSPFCSVNLRTREWCPLDRSSNSHTSRIQSAYPYLSFLARVVCSFYAWSDGKLWRKWNWIAYCNSPPISVHTPNIAP